jgi:hypothetical protein
MRNQKSVMKMVKRNHKYLNRHVHINIMNKDGSKKNINK